MGGAGQGRGLGEGGVLRGWGASPSSRSPLSLQIQYVPVVTGQPLVTQARLEAAAHSAVAGRGGLATLAVGERIPASVLERGQREVPGPELGRQEAGLLSRANHSAVAEGRTAAWSLLATPPPLPHLPLLSPCSSGRGCHGPGNLQHRRRRRRPRPPAAARRPLRHHHPGRVAGASLPPVFPQGAKRGLPWAVQAATGAALPRLCLLRWPGLCWSPPPPHPWLARAPWREQSPRRDSPHLSLVAAVGSGGWSRCWGLRGGSPARPVDAVCWPGLACAKE